MKIFKGMTPCCASILVCTFIYSSAQAENTNQRKVAEAKVVSKDKFKPTEIDPSKNHVLIRAKAGHGPSQIKLAKQYHAKGDNQKALYWAEKFEPYPDMNPRELNELGIIYFTAADSNKSSDLDKETIQRYYDRARYWYEMAAAKNLPHAQFNLARMYYFGIGVDKDLEKTAEYLQRAAKLGLLDARNTLGTFYAEGEGVPMNKEKAVYWYKEAARYGFPNAQYNLAYAYYNGTGIEKDLKKSEDLFYQSCLNGNLKACNRFANLFD